MKMLGKTAAALVCSLLIFMSVSATCDNFASAYAKVEKFPDDICVVSKGQDGMTVKGHTYLPEKEEFSDDVKLIARLTYAEAGCETEEGMRLVIDTVLNRVDSEHFPDTVEEVIYQPKQFTPVWNGVLEKCCASDDICRLVTEEMKERKDSDVIFFRAGRYSSYGVPLYKYGSHYFSSYD